MRASAARCGRRGAYTTAPRRAAASGRGLGWCWRPARPRGCLNPSAHSAHPNTTTPRNQAAAAESLPGAELVVTNAEGSAAKRITDVESLLGQEVDAPVISVQDSDALTP